MLADALALVPDKPNIVPFPDECVAFLREHQIPEDIIADLRNCSYANWFRVGQITIMPFHNLIDELTYSILPCLENGYLALAGGLNGDPIAMDRRSRQMVYISHDILWGEEWKQFEECIHRTPYTYDDFWNAVVTVTPFACDYYEAMELWPRK